MPDTDFAAPITRAEFQLAIDAVRHDIALVRSDTKADLVMLRAELANLKAELIKWTLISALLVLSTILSAIRFLR